MDRGSWIVDRGKRCGETIFSIIHQRSTIIIFCLLPSASALTTVSHGQLTVTYRDSRDAAQLASVFRAWDEAARQLKAIGWDVPKVKLDAALNAADFSARTGEGVAVAAVTRGLTIQTQRLGALAQRGLLKSTIGHEAFHAAQPSSLPRWLAEGLARIFSGEARGDVPSRLSSLSDAQLERQLLARNSAAVAQAYAEASRRAALTLRKVGWAGIWAWR